MTTQRLRDQLANTYLATIPLISLNLAWFLTSLPIITAIPATGALLYATNQLAHGKSSGWGTFFEGFRVYFWRSWIWGLLNILVIVIVASNLVFYAQIGEAWTLWARAVVIALAFFWLTVQMYTFPLLIEQEKPHLRTAMRNSLILLLKRPFYSVGYALVIAVLAAASTLLIQPVWIFFTAGACAYLANLATINAIARVTGSGGTAEPKPDDSL